jgi:hypothetical protein
MGSDQSGNGFLKNLKLKKKKRTSLEGLRCPYCHDSIGIKESHFLECQSCSVMYHDDCVEACITLGCAGTLQSKTVKTTKTQGQATVLQKLFVMWGSFLIAPMLFFGLIALFGFKKPVESLYAFGPALGLLIIGILVYQSLGKTEDIVVTKSPSVKPNLQAATSPITRLPSASPSLEESNSSNFFARPNIAPPKGAGGADDRARQIQQRRDRQSRPGLGKTI